VIENKFKNKLRSLIGIALPSMWILWILTSIFNDVKPIEMIDYMLFDKLKFNILH
jgi:chromate transport protein ChrA